MSISADDILIKDDPSKRAFKAAKLREAQAKAELAELQTAQAKRAERHFQATDDMVHQHYFIGGVDSKNVAECAQHLEFWHRLDPTCDMNVEIHSGGGSCLAGLSLFDNLTRYSLRGGGQHKVTMTVRGLAASMATVLVQAADERVIGPESFFMVHELSGNTAGKIGELEDTMAFYRKLNTRIGEIYVERSGGKCSAEKFAALWTRQDVWLNAQEAFDLGFVDRIEGE
ncbi:head maturation protease [Mycobacterium phage Finemlucis]|uniref:ClpP-like protease n=1 Tax=Mycobacterium phage Finemlucis TaxID=2015844 RepID=A0A291I9X6_9CAUD|nr:head maturation protease [Mycobacterium phage Finemlucis]ATG86502.1 ClpP-like protease [Mycobacterium phage Finemlucis]